MNAPITSTDHVDPYSLLAGLPLAEGGAPPLDPQGVSVRAYPYPYLAAFSIGNDLDSLQADAFEAWHAYVNGRKPTEDGDGLGLEIGDSFWIWGHGDLLAVHWLYPEHEPRE